MRWKDGEKRQLYWLHVRKRRATKHSHARLFRLDMMMRVCTDVSVSSIRFLFLGILHAIEEKTHIRKANKTKIIQRLAKQEKKSNKQLNISRS